MLCCCFFSKSESTSKNYTTNITQDKRLTSQSGDILGVEDSAISVGGNFTVENAGVAKRAIDAVENVAAGAGDILKGVTTGSNDIASEVARSQQKISEIVSGQKTAVWISALGVLAAIMISRSAKK